MKENLNDHNEAALNHPGELNAVRLSPHFKLSEFLNLRKEHSETGTTCSCVLGLET